MIKKLSPKRILALLLSAAAGAVLSLCRVMSAPAPFAAILPAALSPACGAASVFGAAAVGIFSSPAGAAPVIAASAAALIVRLRLGSANRSRALFTLSALSAAAYLLSSAFLCAFSGGGLWEILRALLSALLLFACDCVFVRASSQLGSVRGLAPPTLLFCCGAAVCALCSLRFGPVSLGGIAAAYFVLFAAQRFGPYAAASAAAVFAVGAGICSPSLFGVFALLAIPALICSLPAVSSPLRASLGMIAAVIPAAMLFGEPDGSIGLIIDCVIAAALFIPTYGHSLRLISRLAAGPEPVLRSYRAEMLRSSVEEISDRLAALCSVPAPEPRQVSDAVYSKVCMSCQKNSACFEGSPQSLSGLDSLPAGDLTSLCKALPGCSRISDIRRVSAETGRRREYIIGKNAERGGESRLCVQMLDALGGVISDAERAALRTVSADPNLSYRLRRALKRVGVRFTSCSVYPSGDVEITLPASARINELKIAATVRDIAGIRPQKPERLEYSESVLLRFTPSAEYSAESGVFQIPAEGDSCGDVAESFCVGRFSYFLLSDGMGVGKAARKAAETLSDLLKELLLPGFSAQTAIRLAGAVMAPTLSEESFATLDLLRVDRFTGAAELYKAGGCASVLCSDNSCSVLREGGYPIGILNSCDLKVHRFFVKDSALVMMMTDGAAASGIPACLKALESGTKLSPERLAEAVCQRCAAENSGKRDDISVIAVKIERSRL